MVSISNSRAIYLPQLAQFTGWKHWQGAIAIGAVATPAGAP